MEFTCFMFSCLSTSLSSPSLLSHFPVQWNGLSYWCLSLDLSWNSTQYYLLREPSRSRSNLTYNLGMISLSFIICTIVRNMPGFYLYETYSYFSLLYSINTETKIPNSALVLAIWQLQSDYESIEVRTIYWQWFCRLSGKSLSYFLPGPGVVWTEFWIYCMPSRCFTTKPQPFPSSAAFYHSSTWVFK